MTASHKPRALMDGPPRLKGVWTANVLTLFPEAFPGVLGNSLTGKALSDGLWALNTLNLRDYGIGRHRQVDDKPAGGGPGLVMRADVLGPAIETVLADIQPDAARWPRIYLSPRGMPFTQSLARDWAQADGLTLLCGRFEGVDQRVIDYYQLVEVSLGDFVLTGGEIAAQAMLDATVRLIPGVLGNAASTQNESFSSGTLEYPQYTQPRGWNGHDIPKVLLSGNHQEIARWRQEQAEDLTKRRRPDLWARRHDDKT